LRRVEKLELLYGKGATEASEHVLKKFNELVQEAKEVYDVYEALDYLAASISARPFSALLLNTTRDILRQLALEDYGSLDDVKKRVSSILASTLQRVAEETELAAEVAARRIEDGDVILTHSYSRSVIRSIEKAYAEGKNVKVLVAESRPLLDGLETAKRLARIGIQTTLIVDSAVRYIIREADKVLLGADAITADGGVIARCGSGLVALIAQEARVRVMIVSGTYKLYPETVYGLTIEPPWLGDEIMPDDLKEIGVRGYSPLFETIQANLVDALATERGLLAPEAVPLLIKEIYGSWPPSIEPLEELFVKARKKLSALSRP